MTPEQEIIALDRFIDGLPGVDDQADVEDLFAVVSEIRRLDEPEWPDADFPADASSHIAEVLRSRANQGAAPAPAHSLTSYANGHPLHLPETHPAREPRVRLLRHRHFRDVAQTAAAILAVRAAGGHAGRRLPQPDWQPPGRPRRRGDTDSVVNHRPLTERTASRSGLPALRTNLAAGRLDATVDRSTDQHRWIQSGRS